MRRREHAPLLAAGSADGNVDYQLVATKPAFERMFKLYLSDNAGKFLGSGFTSSIIQKYGFIAVYDMIEPEMKESTKFREIASKSLLTLPVTIDDYNKISIKIIPERKSSGEENKSLQDQVEGAGKEWSPQSIKPIERLMSFTPLEAVRLYRRTLFEKMRIAHKTASPECYHDFLDLDMYLSPFTSSPINRPVRLLFLRPFERIFEDSYLIDNDNPYFLVNRAYAIYMNFPDILAEIFKNRTIDSNKMEAQVRQYIYYWNVASTHFDNIFTYVAKLYYKGTKGTNRNFHLCINNMQYEIIDLETNNQVLSPEASQGMLVPGTIPHIYEPPEPGFRGDQLFSAKAMEDPFAYLRPCFTFKMSGFKSDLRPITEILHQIKAKLTKSKVQSE